MIVTRPPSSSSSWTRRAPGPPATGPRPESPPPRRDGGIGGVPARTRRTVCAASASASESASASAFGRRQRHRDREQRRRDPILKIRSSWLRRPGPPVAVLEAHDVVELRRETSTRSLAALRATSGGALPGGCGRNRPAGAGSPASRPSLRHRAASTSPCQNKQGLVLSFMVLEREALARLEVEDLPGVPLVLREDRSRGPRAWGPSSSDGFALLDPDGRVSGRRRAPHGSGTSSRRRTSRTRAGALAAAPAAVESIRERASLTSGIATGVTDSSRISEADEHADADRVGGHLAADRDGPAERGRPPRRRSGSSGGSPDAAAGRAPRRRDWRGPPRARTGRGRWSRSRRSPPRARAGRRSAPPTEPRS